MSRWKITFIHNLKHRWTTFNNNQPDATSPLVKFIFFKGFRVKFSTKWGSSSPLMCTDKRFREIERWCRLTILAVGFEVLQQIQRTVWQMVSFRKRPIYRASTYTSHTHAYHMRCAIHSLQTCYVTSAETTFAVENPAGVRGFLKYSWHGQFFLKITRNTHLKNSLSDNMMMDFLNIWKQTSVSS